MIMLLMALAYGAGPSAVFLTAPVAGNYLGWIRSSVGFPKGDITEAKLAGYGPVDNRPYLWRVLKKWPDGSVRIGQLKTVVYFGGPQILNLDFGHSPKPGFVWHQKLSDALNQGRLHGIILQANLGSEPLDCVPSAGDYKFLIADAQELVIRFRSHCVNRNTRVDRNVGLTAYWILESDLPTVSLTTVLGNDIREVAQPGVSLTGIDLVVPAGNPAPRLVQAQAFSNRSVLLSDGAESAMRWVMSFDPDFQVNVDMMAVGQPIGFQPWQDLKASHAFMTSEMPQTRIPNSELLNVHNQVNASISFPNANPIDYLGGIDLNPSGTGDQPDFAASMPLDVLKGMQSYSAKMLARLWLQASRETLRPSHWWEKNAGVEDRIMAMTYPDLFMWGSRPHFDFSWNNQYPQWFSRTQNAGFFPAYAGGWTTNDNQHFSQNTLRALYEITGDPLIEDELRYSVSVAYWDFFTDWIFATESERTMRLMKEAKALLELFPDMQESKMLSPKWDQKYQVYRNEVTSRMAARGVPCIGPFNACDSRVGSGRWCSLQPANEQIAVVAWQSGFHMEVEAMDGIDGDQRYLDAVPMYFLPSGLAKTYFLTIDPLSLDPFRYEVGGIGIEWWAGWVQMALKYPKHPNSTFILKNLQPMIDAPLPAGQYFGPKDRWISW